jgi:hypothetical protein
MMDNEMCRYMHRDGNGISAAPMDGRERIEKHGARVWHGEVNVKIVRDVGRTAQPLGVQQMNATVLRGNPRENVEKFQAGRSKNPREDGLYVTRHPLLLDSLERCFTGCY